MVRGTNSDQVVGVKALEIRSHLSNPCLDVLIAAQCIAAGLIDEVPGDYHRVLPVDLQTTPQHYDSAFHKWCIPGDHRGSDMLIFLVAGCIGRV